MHELGLRVDMIKGKTRIFHSMKNGNMSAYSLIVACYVLIQALLENHVIYKTSSKIKPEKNTAATLRTRTTTS